jgi:membrane-associated phospholipid phosphatase
MQVFIESGIAFIIALQSSVGDWFIVPMRFFSYLGNEEFFLLILPLVYWSVDSVLGLQIAFILVTNNLINFVGKLIFAGPRPYWLNSHVRALWTTETGFGVPSNHAQTAMSMWGMLAVYSKRTWVWIVSLAVIFLIGFSRMYLGVHFPHDVIIGWLLGALILWAFVRFWEPFAEWVGKKSLGQQTLIAFIVSLIFIVVGYGTSSLRSGYKVPETWISNSILDGTALPDPVNGNDTFTSAGTLFGLATGAAWIMSMGGYQASGPVGKRAIRYVVGLIGVLIFYMGLGAIFPRGDGLIFYLLRYIRYTLVGFWVAGGAPWVFRKFKLAERASSI